MLNKIKNLLGLGQKIDFAFLKRQGATVLDVRSNIEFESGHIPGSLNIPVDRLSAYMNQQKDKNKIIVTCCASGMRSKNAKNILSVNGFKNVYNGGVWSSLQNKLQ
ncbi:MAG: rhodanese-like domain-containing protein [Ferruginibacter sp.]